MRIFKTALIFLIAGIFLIDPVPVFACSEIYIDKEHKVSARTFDFMFGDGIATITPRGIAQRSASSSWTVKYGNVTFKVRMPAQKVRLPAEKDAGFAYSDVDGINECGLKIGSYFLADSVFPGVGEKPLIAITSLMHFFLDNFKTVDEVISDIVSNKYRVVPVPTDVAPLKLHLYLHDASGSSAILEYINGTVIIYRDPPVHVLTNSTYKESLATLNKYEDFGGKYRIPGGTGSDERFVRGSYYLKYLSPATSSEEAVAYGFDTIQTIAAPSGSDWPSYWTIVTDIDDKKIFFRTISNPAVSYIDLKKIDFSAGQPIVYLDLMQGDLSGDVVSRFKADKEYLKR